MDFLVPNGRKIVNSKHIRYGYMWPYKFYIIIHEYMVIYILYGLQGYIGYIWLYKASYIGFRT